MAYCIEDVRRTVSPGMPYASHVFATGSERARVVLALKGDLRMHQAMIIPTMGRCALRRVWSLQDKRGAQAIGQPHLVLIEVRICGWNDDAENYEDEDWDADKDSDKTADENAMKTQEVAMVKTLPMEATAPMRSRMRRRIPQGVRNSRSQSRKQLSQNRKTSTVSRWEALPTIGMPGV